MNSSLDEAQRKAEVLIEALPYIQKFNRKIIVVKYGGSAMADTELQRSVIQDVTLLKLVGFKPIIVHGGGKAISTWVKKTGKEAQFVNGLRVTDAETMEIAEMVLGRVSKDLVTMVQALGVKAVGISGKDSGMLPKLSNCTEAVRGGVNRVHILDGRVPHSLLLEIFTTQGNGTMFYDDTDRLEDVKRGQKRRQERAQRMRVEQE